METQAGKSSLAARPSAQHGLGRRHRHVGRQRTRRGGRSRAGRRHATAGLHHRLLGAVQDPGRRIVGLNVQPFDAGKHPALSLVADARAGLEELSSALGDHGAPGEWAGEGRRGQGAVDRGRGRRQGDDQRRAPVRRPGDRRRRAGVRRRRPLVCAAGGLPGELHKLWNPGRPGGYHLEYGYSCMGYEIAGGLGVKLARPEDDVVVMVGDGSLPDAEFRDRHLGDAGGEADHRRARQPRLRLHQPAADGDRRGQLQQSPRRTRGTRACPRSTSPPTPARSARMRRRPARSASWRLRSGEPRPAPGVRSSSSTPTRYAVTEAGGHWWDVAVPEVSEREGVTAARKAYEQKLKLQRTD